MEKNEKKRLPVKRSVTVEDFISEFSNILTIKEANLLRENDFRSRIRVQNTSSKSVN